ncbi:hypothetical protein EYS14_09370 [Alteromonadaceae bacterium M269]|nr:hypothetical protein EYS14_09370 [Alteromonadaceae bacterium M269]
MSSPNIEQLHQAISLMADAMNCKPLTQEESTSLVNYVLFDGVCGGVSGKEAWPCYQLDLITKTELRNLIMAHSAARIASFNNTCEPSYLKYPYYLKTLISELSQCFQYKAH